MNILRFLIVLVNIPFIIGMRSIMSVNESEASADDSANPKARGSQRGSQRGSKRRGSPAKPGSGAPAVAWQPTRGSIRKATQRGTGSQRRNSDKAKGGGLKPLQCDEKHVKASLKPVKPQTLPKLRKLLEVTKNDELNKGGDVKEYPDYQDINLLAAWTVENKGVHSKYLAGKKEINPKDVKRASIPITKRVGSIPGVPKLNQAYNEQWFFHGTKPPFVSSIACNGLREGGGLFGKGVYLADAPEKFDQYTTHTGEGKNKILDDHAPAGSNYSKAKGDVFYAFVVRAMMGRTFEGNCGCDACNKTAIKCNRCGAVSQFGTGDVLKSYWRDAIVQPSSVTNAKGKNAYAPSESLKEMYNSVCVESAKGTCISRFNECIVPEGSYRAQVEILFAYERCKNPLSKGKCSPVKR